MSLKSTLRQQQWAFHQSNWQQSPSPHMLEVSFWELWDLVVKTSCEVRQRRSEYNAAVTMMRAQSALWRSRSSNHWHPLCSYISIIHTNTQASGRQHGVFKDHVHLLYWPLELQPWQTAVISVMAKALLINTAIKIMFLLQHIELGTFNRHSAEVPHPSVISC